MQTKTLADLKRDIAIGNSIELIEYLDATTQDQIPEKLKGIRYVTKVDTTGFYLNPTPEDGKRGSKCDYPKASNLSYVGDTFTISEHYPYDMNSPLAGKLYQKRTYRVLGF